MKANHILETVLYCEDLAAAKHFYKNLLGLELFKDAGHFLGFRLPRSILLIFNPELSRRNDRPLPSHGTESNGHIAFSATQKEIGQWRIHLEKHGVQIEKKHVGNSLYVRDPSGNLVEFNQPSDWGEKWNATEERFE